MQEALREAPPKTLPSVESTKVVHLESEAERNHGPAISDFDVIAQQECFKLVQRIFLAQTDNALRAVVFAGIDRGNGCSRICVEAARLLAANTSGSVCLVDANLRSPALPRFFSLLDGSGLVNSLAEEGVIRRFATQLNPANLWLLPAGARGADSLSSLNSDRLKERLQELRKEFDYVLIDAPALSVYADALALGQIADGIVVVLQADSTRRGSALKSLQTLREARIEVLGAVLNRRTFPIPDFVYHRL